MINRNHLDENGTFLFPTRSVFEVAAEDFIVRWRLLHLAGTKADDKRGVIGNYALFMQLICNCHFELHSNLEGKLEQRKGNLYKVVVSCGTLHKLHAERKIMSGQSC